MKITSGIYEVYDSGFVISFGNEPLSFHFEEESGNLTLTVVFKDTPNEDLVTISFDEYSDDELRMNLNNVRKITPIGITEPVLIGDFSGRELYLNFTCYTLGEGVGKSFHYTWYLGKPVSEPKVSVDPSN